MPITYLYVLESRPAIFKYTQPIINGTQQKSINTIKYGTVLAPFTSSRIYAAVSTKEITSHII